MKDFSSSLFKLSFLGVLLGLCAGASAQCKYTTLNIPGTNSAANGINDKGGIVGVFNPGDAAARSFLLFQGKFTPFNFPGATTSVASDINNHGQIVGTYVASTGAHGFVVHNGVFHSIDAPQPPGDTQTQAFGINNFGVIVGNAGIFGFRLSSGHFTTVHFPESSSTSASSINDSGVIVGTYRDASGNFNHGFMLKNGHYTALNFPGADQTFVSHINNEGDIVGFYVMHGDVHGFTLDKGRFLTHDDNTGFSTVISGVNRFDTIVGNFVDVDGHNHSFKATCTGVF